MTDPPRRVRCPMGDWAQVAPDRETATRLLTRHLLGSHMVGPDRVPAYAIARADAKLTHCPYVPPTGEWIPSRP